MPAPPNTYVQIVASGTLAAAGSGTKNVANVFIYKRTSTTFALSNPLVEAAFNAAVMVPYLAAANARYSQTGTTVRQIDDAASLATNVVRSGVGAIATASFPDYVAVCFRLYTALRGRSWRGSKHFAAPSEADTTGDILTGAGLALWQAVGVALAANLTDANGNIWVPQVMSFYSTPVKGQPKVINTQLTINPTIIGTQPVTAVVLNKTVGIMRRRKTKSVI